jgi:hypothetical protein
MMKARALRSGSLYPQDLESIVHRLATREQHSRSTALAQVTVKPAARSRPGSAVPIRSLVPLDLVTASHRGGGQVHKDTRLRNPS